MADWYFRNNQGGGQARGNLVSCPGCRNLVRAGEEFCPYCARRLGPEKGIHGWIRKTLNQEFIATKAFIGACAVVFLLQLLTDLFLPSQYRFDRGGMFSLLAAQPFTYFRMGSNYQPFVLAYGQVWRFMTYCFLHIGIIHILFNSWAFWDLGRLAERLWGAKQVFAVFVFTGIAGGAASLVWHALIWRMPTNSAGASGAICGILGLLLGAYYKNRFHIGEMLGSQLVRWAVYIVVFGLVAGADNGAHIGGMAVGALFGYYLPPTGRTRTPDRDAKIWRIAAVAAAILLIVSLVFAVIFYARGFDHVALLLAELYQ